MHSPAKLFADAQRWSEEKANGWYQQQPWLVGSNFIPSTAINELEMWQAATFDPQEIDKELGWAQSLGMNTMRVFLHDLLWQQDAAGFKQRIDAFLTISAKHHIRPVLFCLIPAGTHFPSSVRNMLRSPGVHNSGWMQSPGAAALQDPAQYPRLKEYVQGVVGAFANDPRVLAWDLWNEPNNTNDESLRIGGTEEESWNSCWRFCRRFSIWARSANPSQPLTSGVWEGDWSSPEKLSPTQRIQLEQSDVISFHNYSWPEDFEKRVEWLERYHRPILCTEYMARPMGSTFDAILPIAKKDVMWRRSTGDWLRERRRLICPGTPGRSLM